MATAITTAITTVMDIAVAAEEEGVISRGAPRAGGILRRIAFH
jgi:hypothetical protein